MYYISILNEEMHKIFSNNLSAIKNNVKVAFKNRTPFRAEMILV